MHAVSGLMWATRQCVNKYPFSGVTVCGCTITGGGKLALEWAIAGSWIMQIVIGMIFCALPVCGWSGYDMLYSSCNTTKRNQFSK